MELAKTTNGSNAVQQFQSNALSIWKDEKKIRELFAKTLSQDEFKFFIGLGIALQANPFTREIWAIKYGNNPASIFTGRDFSRRKAQEQPDYDGHYCDSVYENDTYKVENGVPQHSYQLTNRGKLIGAYCLVRKKNISQPFYVFVLLHEYDKGQSNWKTMKDTMIKKVAEAQGLRGAFQGVLGGTYDESEIAAIQANATSTSVDDMMPKKKDEFSVACVEEESVVNDDFTEEINDSEADFLDDAIEPDPEANHCSANGCHNTLTPKVRDYSMKRFGKALCFECQKGDK